MSAFHPKETLAATNPAFCVIDKGTELRKDLTLIGVIEEHPRRFRFKLLKHTHKCSIGNRSKRNRFWHLCDPDVTDRRADQCRKITRDQWAGNDRFDCPVALDE